MKINIWAVIVIIFILSVFVFFWIHDTETPTIEKKVNNQTVTACADKDAWLQPSKNNKNETICFKEAFIGHTKITTPQIIWIMYTTIIGGMLLFQGWREFKSSKLFFQESKYHDDLFVNIHSAVLESKGFIRVRGGYDAYVHEKNNDFYVASKEMCDTIGKCKVFTGGLRKINHQTLYEYLKKDLQLLKDVMMNDDIIVKNGKISLNNAWINLSPPPRIFVPVKLPAHKSRQFLSLAGNYSISADRYNVVMKMLLKLETNIQSALPHMKQSNEYMLESAKNSAQETANAAEQYRRTRDVDIISTREQTIQNGTVFEEEKP